MDQHDGSGMLQKEPLIRSGFFGGCFFERMGLIEKSERYATEVRERAVRLVFSHGNEHQTQWSGSCECRVTSTSVAFGANATYSRPVLSGFFQLTPS